MIASKREYDVAIIGGGIGGLMTAYEITNNRPDLKIILFESGKTLKDRACPIVTGKVEQCIGCTPCSIMRGIAGAGAFSDGKYNITTEFGGWLRDFVGDKVTMEYIRRCSNILEEFGATKDLYMPNDDLKLECIKHDLHMLQAEVKHLGTDENYKTMMNLFNFIDQHTEVHSLTNVYDVNT